MRVGLLTGGGDCPGLNAVIRAVVRKGERHYGDELVGFRDGWRGVIGVAPESESACVAPSFWRIRGLLDRAPRALPSCWRRYLPSTRFA